MKRQQQKSAKSVAFLTLPLTEQPRMQSLFIPCFSFFFYQLVSHDYRIKISSASILIFHQQLEECCFLFLQIYVVRMCIYVYRRTPKYMYVLYTGWSEVKLVKRITVLSWQPLIKDHLNNRRPTARISHSHSHPRHSASSSFTTALLSFPQLLSVEMCTERKYEILFENTIYELLEMEAIF